MLRTLFLQWFWYRFRTEGREAPVTFSAPLKDSSNILQLPIKEAANISAKSNDSCFLLCSSCLVETNQTFRSNLFWILLGLNRTFLHNVLCCLYSLIPVCFLKQPTEISGSDLLVLMWLEVKPASSSGCFYDILDCTVWLTTACRVNQSRWYLTVQSSSHWKKIKNPSCVLPAICLVHHGVYLSLESVPTDQSLPHEHKIKLPGANRSCFFIFFLQLTFRWVVKYFLEMYKK